MIPPPVPYIDANWTRSDRYFNSFLIPDDRVLTEVLENNRANGLPDISVSTAQGKFLNLLARSICAKRILEVGTLGAYSTIWMARALPKDGEVITCEISPQYAELARKNLEIAGLSSQVQVVVGPAAETLKEMHPEVPFDLIFIDADKASNLIYFTEAKRLVRKMSQSDTLLAPAIFIYIHLQGGLIIVDNVVREGRVADPSLSDEKIEGVRSLITAMQFDDDVDADVISTVGEKGHDGFLYAVRL